MAENLPHVPPEEKSNTGEASMTAKEALAEIRKRLEALRDLYRENTVEMGHRNGFEAARDEHLHYASAMSQALTIVSEVENLQRTGR